MALALRNPIPGSSQLKSIPPTGCSINLVSHATSEMTKPVWGSGCGSLVQRALPRLPRRALSNAQAPFNADPALLPHKSPLSRSEYAGAAFGPVEPSHYGSRFLPRSAVRVLSHTLIYARVGVHVVARHSPLLLLVTTWPPRHAGPVRLSVHHPAARDLAARDLAQISGRHS
jgi:hypothetical protein